MVMAGTPPEVVKPVIDPGEEQVAFVTTAVPDIVAPPTVTTTGFLNVPGQVPT
jgi:hypothetical protein